LDKVGRSFEVNGVAAAFDDTEACLGQTLTYPPRELRELGVMFARNEVDGPVQLAEAFPERGQSPGADVFQTQGEAFRVVLVAAG